ncbi:Insulin-like growth factor-binding protein 3 [Varanus komodoensis]|nr:Insulin-like growth factor-binding protein 3 [Varanus komodoensis]
MPPMWTSSLSLNTRTDGASTTSRGSPFHTLGVLIVRKCFLASNWNLGSLSFAPLERCRPSRGRKRGYCWCVDKYGQPLPGYDGKGKGDVHCYNLESK